MLRGGGGLLVREGGSGVSRSSPTFLPLPSRPGGSGEGVQAGKTHWPSGLGPQPGGASPGPYSALQTPGLLSRLPLHPLLGPEPQAEESRPERRGAGDCPDGRASSPSCLSVCLLRCVSGAHWVQLGAMRAQRLPGPPVAGGQL